MTLATDYLLAGVSVWFALLLFRRGGSKFWADAFGMLALTALAGGTYHGFPQFYPGLLWGATELLAGLTSFLLVVATARATGYFPRTIFGLATAKLMLYLALIVSHEEFIWVVIDSGSALLFVAVLHTIKRDAAWRWMVGGVALSAVAVGVQAAQLAPHPQFNHNDLFHVIQIAALWLLYRGARLL
jgi:hypothetical protein